MVTVAESNNIEVDTENQPSEIDSIYSADTDSLTDTITTALKTYRYENGRRYHSYKDGSWIVPNDENQQDQMDLFHEVYCRGQGNELFLAPIGDDNIKKVLDLGTGTGIWAIQLADQYQDATVIGNDLSPIQPSWVPKNCSFEVDDFNEQWSHAPGSFDFVHARAIHGAVDNWVELSKQAFKALKPGGWFEVSNELVSIKADDGTLSETSPLHKWLEYATEGCEKIGKTAHNVNLLEGAFKTAGFDMKTYKQQVFKNPIGTWPKEKKQKEIGALNMVNLVLGIEGFLLAICTRVLGHSKEDTMKLAGEIKAALKDKKSHIYMPMHTTYVQKPKTA